ncbi:PfkB family carbohydrate kinase [Streptomyces sp. INA 01156]
MDRILPSRPDAVVCANDLIAVGALRRLRQLGVDVPGEIAVTGFDDIPVADLAEPPLTTVRQPVRALATEATHLLGHRLTGQQNGQPDGPRRSVRLAPNSSYAHPARPRRLGAGHRQYPQLRGKPVIAVVGSLNLDLVVPVPRHPVPGETVLGEGIAQHPGGKGANQAVAAARLGGNVSFVGRVGEDDAADVMLDAVRSEGVDVTHITRTPGVATGRALIAVDPAGENTIIVSPGANARVSTADCEARRTRCGRRP